MAYVPSVEDIVNQALRAGGVEKRIADIYEGSEASKVALELYGQARDELIDEKYWSFTRRKLPLTLLKGPPPDGGYNPVQPWSNIYPDPGFLFSYAYPDDCIDLKAIIEPPGQMPDTDPFPAEWRLDNDQTPVVSGTPPVASGPPAKVILCNVQNAIAIYSGQITDITQWEPGFIKALVSMLGKRFAQAFGADPNQVKEDLGEAAFNAQTGSMERG